MTKDEYIYFNECDEIECEDFIFGDGCHRNVDPQDCEKLDEHNETH